MPARLKPRMDALDLHRCTAVLCRIDLRHDRPQFALGVLTPCRRCRSNDEGKARQCRQRLRLADDLVQPLVDRGAREERDVYLVLIHADNAEICRGLHSARLRVCHGMNPRAQEDKEVDEGALFLRADDAPRLMCRMQRKFHRGIGLAVDGMKAFLLRRQQTGNAALIHRRADDCLCRRRDRVARRSARERNEFHVPLLCQRMKCQCQRANRIAAPVADALARVTAAQPLSRNAIGGQIGFLSRQRTRIVEIDTARTADRHDVIVLRVAVDQVLCILQMICRKMPRPRHALFLIHRDDGAQRTMFLRALHCRQDLRHTDAVVSAKARPIRREILRRPLHLDRVGQRVIGNARLSHTDHVHVSLQDRARCILLPLRRRKLRDDIEVLILRHRAANLLKVFFQIVTDRLLVPRRTRDMRQCLELRNDLFQQLCIIHHKFLPSKFLSIITQECKKWGCCMK